MLKRDQHQDPGPHELVTYGDIVQFGLKYWRIIGAGAALGLGASILYLMIAEPIFAAETQVLIETDLPQTFRDQMTESYASLDTPQVESQLAIIRSQQIAEKVVKRLGLVSPPETPVQRSSIRRLLSWMFGATPETAPVDPMAGAAAGIRAGLDAQREGLSHAININFRATDPVTAAQVANAIADAYVEDQLDTRAEAASQGGKWLEGRIDELRKQMNAAALDVQQFKAKRDYRIVNQRGATEGAAAPQTVNRAAEEPARPQLNDTNTLEELESRALTYRKIFESYLQAYAETVQRQSYPMTNARVITRAATPTRKTFPKSKLSLAAGLVAGLLAGLGAALVMSGLGLDGNLPKLPTPWRRDTPAA
jgi:uncharacterized protein involved in exopolysaccharide biosynthesis